MKRSTSILLREYMALCLVRQKILTVFDDQRVIEGLCQYIADNLRAGVGLKTILSVMLNEIIAYLEQGE